MRHTGTESEKREYIVNTLNVNMFVEAGAGAGKTTLIVARITNQLKSGMKPREIVAITFTNAATRSLRERIIKEVQDTVQRGGLSPEETENITEALKTIDQMQISTIHSFCSRMLKECCLEADLPMALTLIDKERLPEMVEESFTRWAETLTIADWRTLRAGVRSRGQILHNLRKFTLQCVGISPDVTVRIGLPDVSEEEYQLKMPPYADEIRREFLQAVGDFYKRPIANLEDVPEDWLMTNGKKLLIALKENDYAALADVVCDEPESVGKILKAPRNKADFTALFQIADKDADGRKAETNRIRALDHRFWEYLKNLENPIRILQGGYENRKMRPFVELAKQAAAYFYDTLPTGLLTNDMLIRMARELVENSPAARAYLGEKFKCIYVDEFQDTDHVQDAMIRRLVSDPADSSKLRDGALFVVGDPKQSIYRFRGAEPEVYFATKQILEDMSNACVLELADNYRSNDRIINWVNTVFADKDITPGHAYAPMKLPDVKPGMNLAEDGLLAGVYKYNTPLGPVQKGQTDISETADLVLNLVNGPYKIPVFDKNTGAWVSKKVQFSDILILCQKMPKMKKYADEFRRLGIPFVMDSKESLNKNAFLNALVRLYACIADPYDSFAHIGAVEVLRNKGFEDGENVENAIKHLQKSTEAMSGAGKLRWLADRWELCVPKKDTLSKQQLKSYHTRVTQMTEKVLTSCAGNETAILAGLQTYVAGELEHELVTEEKVNAVRFMNLHKAKGLEGNIVIWANRTEDMKFKFGTFTDGLDFYPSLSDAIYSGWTGYNRHPNLEAKAKDAYTAELTRLEYVAVTRAQQVFIFMDMLWSACMFRKDYPLTDLPSIKSIVEEKKNTPPTPEPVSEEVHVGKAEPGDTEAGKPLYVSQSPSMFEDESAGKRSQAAGDIDELRPAGNLFGNVLHRSMELLLERAGKTTLCPGISMESLYRICALQAISEEDIDPEDTLRAAYETSVVKMLGVFWSWLNKNYPPEVIKTIYTELPFTYFTDFVNGKGEQIPAWRHGSADLVLALKDGRYVILDFKSDTDRSYATPQDVTDRLVGKYQQQIAAYAEAVKELFKAPKENITAVLVSFPERHPVDGGRAPRITAVPIVDFTGVVKVVH